MKRELHIVSFDIPLPANYGGVIDVFYKIKTSSLSLLQPKIRLYKVQYEDFTIKPDGTPDIGSVRALPVPCYKEYKFSDNFGVETAASAQDYLAYESTRPNFRNVGLEGFSISQNGETHGTIENNIECKLDLTFKSLKDLNASPPGEPNLRYVDLILWPPARFAKDAESYNPKHYEIKALIGYTAPPSDQLRALNIPQSEINAIRDIEKLNQIVSLGMYDYDIKIEENGVVKVSVSYRGRLETVIGTNQVNIFQDSMRIGEEGQFEVIRKADSDMNISHVFKTVTHIKSLHAALSKARCKFKECEERKTLKDLTEKDPLLPLLIKETIGVENLPAHGLVQGAGKSLKITDPEKYYSWFRKPENAKKLLALIKNKVGQFKQQIYTGFVNALVEGNKKREHGLPFTRVYCAKASSKDLEKSVGIITEGKRTKIQEAKEGEEAVYGLEVSQSEIEKKIKKFSTDIEGQTVAFEFKRCKEELGALKKQNKLVGESIAPEAGLPEKAAASEEAEPKKGEEKPPKGVAPAWMTGGDYKFYFVFLGDIIELACKNARMGALTFEGHQRGKDIFWWEEYQPVKSQDGATSYPLVNARLLLGPVEYLDSDGAIQSMNLAKMPISFSYFRSWFVNKIIKRRRTQMPLGAFLSSLINDLVIPALGIDMPESFKPPHTRASIVALTLPGVLDRDITHSICGKTVPASREALPMLREINTEDAEFEKYLTKIVSRRSSESMLQSSYDYLLIYVTSFKDITERRADPAVDVKDGIYHFNIGSDMGLLRTMDFSRVNLPYLQEMRSQQAEEQGIDQLEQLKLPYDTNVNLIGTSLFTPGMFYYVNPSLAGLGSVKNAGSLAYQMNLGGYHLVGQVTTNIGPGRFETKIVGTQTAQGKR